MAREDTQTNQLGEESAVHQIREDLAGHEDTIRQLVSAIRHQIHDSDERHTGVLSNMQQRLGSLTTDVHDIRQRIPENLSGNLERLEQGLDTLSDRVATIAAHYDEPAASEVASIANLDPVLEEAPQHDDASATEPAAEPPVALRSGEASETTETAPQNTAPAASKATDVDTFDMVETSLPGDPSSPWDRDTAEALATVYDDEETISQFKVEDASHAEVEAAPVRTPDPEAPAEPAAFYSATDVDAVSERTPAIEREWLESKFSEIAERIEASLSDFNPEQTYHQISERFDDFEQRLGNALVDVATQSDLGPLRELEAQLGELTSQLTATESNMQRLDSIEGHLSQVSSKLGEGAAAFAEMPAQGAVDPHQLAEAAAARVAEHLAAAGLGAAGGQIDDGAVQEVRGLVEGLMSESREGNEQTSMMLDTMQQAMMRILDRLDALEVSQYQASAPRTDVTLAPHAAAPAMDQLVDDEQSYGEVEAAASGWQDGSDLGQPSDVTSPDEQAFEEGTYQDADVEIHAADAGADAEAFDVEPEPQAPAYPSHDLISHGDAAVSVPAEPKASSRDAIDKIRHNFIRDAQRAKEQAAAEAAQASLEEPNKKGRKRRSILSATPTEPTDGQSGGMFGSKTRRLLVGALVAVILINGALYLMPRSKDGNAAKSPASISKQEKSSTDKKDSGPKDQSSLLGAEDLLHRAVSDQTMEAQVKEAMIDAHHRSQGALELPFGLTLQQSSAEEWTAAGNSTVRAVPAALTSVEASPSSKTLKSDKTLEMPHSSVGPHSLRLAASKGDPSAQFEVATRLAEAKGTKQNIDQAVAWFKRSAAQGFAQSQYRLGTLYERGLGVKKDAKRAKIWYLRAAEQGNIKAMHNLAVLSAGQQSGSPDYATAAQWFLKAAERGLADSQFNVGVLFENGLGVGQDSNAAYKWYTLAARTGDKEAMKRSQKLRASLTIEELGEAEKLVRSFVAEAIDPVINNARLAGQEWKKRTNG